MTKSELIELLEDVEDDTEILIHSDNWGCDIAIDEAIISDKGKVLLIVDIYGY